MGTDVVTCERRVGRLVEIRVPGTPGEPELHALAQGMIAIAAALSGSWVTVVDCRRTIMTSDPTARGLIDLMVQYNARTQRSAYLLGGQTLFAVQLEAMVLQAHNPGRRVFRKREELVAWLGESCTLDERARLALFLDD